MDEALNKVYFAIYRDSGETKQNNFIPTQNFLKFGWFISEAFLSQTLSIHKYLIC